MERVRRAIAGKRRFAWLFSMGNRLEVEKAVNPLEPRHGSTRRTKPEETIGGDLGLESAEGVVEIETGQGHPQKPPSNEK